MTIESDNARSNNSEPDSSKHPVNTREFHLAYAATFGFLLAILLTAMLISLRASYGFENQDVILSSLKLLVLSGAIFFSPFAFTPIWQNQPARLTYVVVTIFVSPLLAFLIGQWLLPILFMIFIMGIHAALRVLAPITRSQILGLFGLAIFTSAHISMWLYKPEWAWSGPFVASIINEHATLGELYSDTLFHASIVAMINGHSTISTGLDGLTPFSYHVGAHIWFAALASMTSAETLTTIMVGELVVMIPASLTVLALSLVLTMRRLPHAPIAYVSCVIALLIVRDLACGWVGTYASITFVTASVFMAAAAPHLFDLAKDIERNRRLKSEAIVAVIALSCLALYAKLHVGVALIVMSTTLVLLAQKSPSRLMAIGLVSVLCTLAVLYGLIGDKLIEILVQFFTLNLSIAFPGASIFYIMPAICIWAYSHQIVSIAKQRDTPHDNAATHIIAIAVLALLLVSGVLVWTRTHNDANAHWMGMSLYSMSIFMAVPALLHGRLQEFVTRLISPSFPRSMHDSALLIVQYLIITVYLLVFVTTTNNHLKLIAAARAKQTGGGADAIIALKKAIDGVRQSDGSPLIVFAPPENLEFWGLVKKCRSKAFLVPALTGVPMLKGIPPVNMGCSQELVGYSYDQYGPDAVVRQLGKIEACTEAAHKGFSRVLVVKAPIQSGNHGLWNCGRILSAN
ncbi:MAG: hypothetical protein HKN11_10855 [Rhizobiales bacterium]|nr:hypothetical protein [Hyphomicrobiales bacterium]